MDYKCSNCGCEEFVSQLNRYDIFMSNNKKLEYQRSEIVDDKTILYCRECRAILEFDNKDLA